MHNAQCGIEDGGVAARVFIVNVSEKRSISASIAAKAAKRFTISEMNKYRPALGRMRIAVDDNGERIWIERMGKTDMPDVYYKYDSNGRLMKHTRKLFGYVIEPVEYARFGEHIRIEVVKRKPTYCELR